MHTAMRAGQQITRLTALSEVRTCDLRNTRPTHCLCGHSGYKGLVGQTQAKDSKIFIGTVGLIIVGWYKIVWKYSTVVYNYRRYKVLEVEMEYY